MGEPEEVAERNNMSRTEKNSRIRFLPPVVQTTILENVSSGPKTYGFEDGKKPGTVVAPFDDSRTLPTRINNTVINLPSSLPSSSVYIDSELKIEGMFITGSPRNQRTLILQHSLPTDSFTPFTDFTLPEADNTISSSFYLTASTIFEGRVQDRFRIEIDITPTTENQYSINGTNGSSFPMIYWNHSTKAWDGVGNGSPFDKAGVDTFPIGFGYSLDDGTLDSIYQYSAKALCNPTSHAGFPYHNIFNQDRREAIAMSDYITEPFLLEKMVLFTSISLDLQNDFPTSETYNCITTFFILNQRGGFLKEVLQYRNFNTYVASTLTRYTSQSFTTGSFTTTRDLVTWAQISKYVSTGITEYDERMPRELVVETTPQSNDIIFNQQCVISASIKQPFAYTGLTVAFDDSLEFEEQWSEPYRNFNQDSGRNYKNTYTNPTVYNQYEEPSALDPSDVKKKYSYDSYSFDVPYLLLPEDRLTLGWQLPYTKLPHLMTYDGPKLSLSNLGVNKLILFGTYLKQNQPKEARSLEPVKYEDIFSVKLKE